MAWETIERRLMRPLTVTVSFPSGTVWLPERRLQIDQWLIGAADSDEELRELNIPRIQFLEHRWRIEKLVELRWEQSSDRAAIYAMNVRDHAFILFWKGGRYYLAGALTPNDAPSLYRAVIGKLLQDSTLAPDHPTVHFMRPDLTLPSEEGEGGATVETLSKDAYLTEVCVGWIGRWMDAPVFGYWYHEEPEAGPHGSKAGNTAA